MKKVVVIRTGSLSGMSNMRLTTSWTLKEFKNLMVGKWTLLEEIKDE